LRTSPHHLPLSPLPLCCSAAPLAAPCWRSPWLPAAPRHPNRTTWPSSSPARRSPDPAGFSPPRHVVPPSPAAATRATGRLQLLQLAHASSWFRSASRSPPRLLLSSHAPAFSPLFFFFARHHRRTSAAVSSHRHQPPPPPHTRNPVLHRHHYIPLKLPGQLFSIPSRSRNQNAAPAVLSTTAARPNSRPDASPPLGPHRAHHQHHIYA
jgi:hypothetical protein